VHIFVECGHFDNPCVFSYFGPQSVDFGPIGRGPSPLVVKSLLEPRLDVGRVDRFWQSLPKSNDLLGS
jgi:hypothetical protein